MKTGMTLNEMASELTRQQNEKRDFVADTRKIYMDPETNEIELDLNGQTEHFTTERNTHTQIAQNLKIPQQYYDRMPKDLRAVNVNHWLRENPQKRMVRTLDGKARAFMSDRYRVLDNYDLANAVLPVLAEQPDMEIVSTQLTDTRFYIKALFPKIEGELGVGDLAQSGIVIRNSEVGKGALDVSPLVYRKVCSNGMIANSGQKRYHVGKATGSMNEALELYSDETLRKDDMAFWAKVQDTVRASVSQVGFNNILEDMRRTKGMDLGNPIDTVERTAKKMGWNDTEQGSVLSHLIKDGDLSGFGLLNAITRTSQDIEDYDRATEFERMGGKIIELSQRDWRELTEAA